MLTAQPLPSERWEQTYYWTSCSLESCRRYPAWFQWNHLPSTFPKHVSSSISWACAEHSQDRGYSIHSRSNPSVDDTHLDHHCSLESTWWAQGGDEEQTSTHQQSSLSRAWGHQFKASPYFEPTEGQLLQTYILVPFEDILHEANGALLSIRHIELALYHEDLQLYLSISYISSLDLIFSSTAQTGTLMMLMFSRFINWLEERYARQEL